MRKTVLFVVLALIGGFVGAMATHVVLGQVIEATGDVGKFTGVTVSSTPTDVCTSSSAFTDMPGAMVTFRQNGNGRAVVLFQARWFSDTQNVPARVRIRPAVDSIPEDANIGMWTLQGGRFLINPNQINGSSGMNFITDPLTPGPHLATIQWRSQIAGQQICVGRISMIVLHR